MTITVAILRAAGISDAQLLRVLELEKAADRELELARKERNRIANREFRQRNQSSRDKRDDHANHAPIERESKNLSFLPEESLSSLKDSPRGKTLNRKGGLVALPEDFAPDLKTQLYGSSLGFTQPQFERQLEAMRNWAASGGHRKVDWQATFRNWLSNSAPGGRFAANGGNGNGKNRETLKDVGEKLIAKLRAREANSLGGGDACDPHVVGLSGNTGDLFGGISCDASGNVVPISARSRDGRS